MNVQGCPTRLGLSRWKTCGDLMTPSAHLRACVLAAVGSGAAAVGAPARRDHPEGPQADGMAGGGSSDGQQAEAAAGAPGRDGDLYK